MAWPGGRYPGESGYNPFADPFSSPCSYRSNNARQLPPVEREGGSSRPRRSSFERRRPSEAQASSHDQCGGHGGRQHPHSQHGSTLPPPPPGVRGMTLAELRQYIAEQCPASRAYDHGHINVAAYDDRDGPPPDPTSIAAQAGVHMPQGGSSFSFAPGEIQKFNQWYAANRGPW